MEKVILDFVVNEEEFPNVYLILSKVFLNFLDNEEVFCRCFQKKHIITSTQNVQNIVDLLLTSNKMLNFINSNHFQQGESILEFYR